MSRKRTTTDTPPVTATPADEMPALKVFAPDAEPPASEAATAVAEPPAAEAKADGRSFVERVGQKLRPAMPDPFGIASDSLAGVRLYESRQDRQVALKFNEKPTQAIIDLLKEAGYRWNPADKIWAHPLAFASAMRTRIEAEQLYQEVAKMIRQEKGIEAGKEVPF
jgi:hypothetical protein